MECTTAAGVTMRPKSDPNSDLCPSPWHVYKNKHGLPMSLALDPGKCKNLFKKGDAASALFALLTGGHICEHMNSLV